MHIISRRRLLESAERHNDLYEALDYWYRIAKKATWSSLEEVRLDFASADGVGRYTVFNIRGNKYRLIVRLNYKGQRAYILHLLTHAEYDKGGWKQ